MDYQDETDRSTLTIEVWEEHPRRPWHWAARMEGGPVETGTAETEGEAWRNAVERGGPAVMDPEEA